MDWSNGSLPFSLTPKKKEAKRKRPPDETSRELGILPSAVRIGRSFSPHPLRGARIENNYPHR
jgi:hypothetical protein